MGISKDIDRYRVLVSGRKGRHNDFHATAEDQPWSEASYWGKLSVEGVGLIEHG